MLTFFLKKKLPFISLSLSLPLPAILSSLRLFFLGHLSESQKTELDELEREDFSRIKKIIEKKSEAAAKKEKQSGEGKSVDSASTSVDGNNNFSYTNDPVPQQGGLLSGRVLEDDPDVIF